MDFAPTLKFKFSWKTLPFFVVLLFLSLIYETIVLIRLAMYKKGILQTKKAEVSIISVGNLTVGGTGKTPMVDFLVRELKQMGVHTAILSRGYGNHTQSSLQRILISEKSPNTPFTCGDEPYLLASRNPSVPVYIGRNRKLSSILAQLWDHPQMLVLDDGYQHLQLQRDLNLLLIDAEQGLGNGCLLPLGELREPAHHWQRADAIILTKSNLGFSDRVLHQLHNQQNITCPVFKFNYAPFGLRRLDRQENLDLAVLPKKRVLLSCGIARPEGFTLVLKQLNAEVVDMISFDDHYIYSPHKINSLLQYKQKINPDFWITTEKDAVKLQQFSELANEVWVMEMQIIPDPYWQEFFIDFLKRIELK